MVFGCALGLFIGAMPGLGSVNGVAILLPMTFLVPPTGAIIFLAAIYYGAMYGGAISSIMLGIPGASTAVATTFDGRPLALAGKADQALITAAGASFIGGTVSVILFTLFAPPLAEVALAFGSAEEFALMMLAFATFIGLGGDDIPKTLFSIFIGLVLSAVGLDIISGEPRLIFGDLPGFFHGIHFLVLAIGIYGIGEMLWTIESNTDGVKVSQASFGVRRIFAHLKGDPESFGKGNVEGIAAPESANNSASTGSMLPMLTLGIPGSPTTAILLGGMVIWGLEPGPMLFIEHEGFVWGLIASLYVANLVAMLINLAFIPAFIAVLRMPFTILAPIIFVLCLVGGYAPTQNMHDVWLILIFGVAGYLMRKLDYPLAPAVLAIVLGPLAETSMRQALLMSDGSLMIFFERPISGMIMWIAIVLFLLPLIKFYRAKITKNTN